MVFPNTFTLKINHVSIFLNDKFIMKYNKLLYINLLRNFINKNKNEKIIFHQFFKKKKYERIKIV